MSKSATALHPLAPGASLLSAEGRAARPFRLRVGAALAVVAALHVIGLGLLGLGLADGGAGALTAGVAAAAYLRGLVHSFDFDHISMIDNSTRKFVGEGRDPASVGLAFSAGHSTVVLLTAVAVISGVGFIRTALDAGSTTASVLAVIGLSVSGLYLLLVALANVAGFGRAWQLRRAVRADPTLVIPREALLPRGPAAAVLTAPLRRVRHPRHVYALGFLFSLGFDTSSQIGVLVLTVSASLAGAPPLSLLCLPVLFAAAMTLGDTANGVVMVRLYTAVQHDPARRITYNLLVTGVGIASGLVVAGLAVAAVLSDHVGLEGEILAGLAAVDTSPAGYWLAGLCAVIGVVAWARWRAGRPVVPGTVSLGVRVDGGHRHGRIDG